jgi:hypothetical protein
LAKNPTSVGIWAGHSPGEVTRIAKIAAENQNQRVPHPMIVPALTPFLSLGLLSI